MGLDPEFCPRAGESGSRFDRHFPALHSPLVSGERITPPQTPIRSIRGGGLIRTGDWGAWERLGTHGARLFVAGHGLQIPDDDLDVCLRQRIEVGHPGSRSDTAGVRNESAQEARIPVFRDAARRIQFRPEGPAHAIDGMAFHTNSPSVDYT